MIDADKYLGWIAFKNELPEIGITVLAYNSVTDRFSLVTRYEKYYAVAVSCYEGRRISPPERVVNLSHWRLLPFPPMAEEKEMERDITELFSENKNNPELNPKQENIAYFNDNEFLYTYRATNGKVFAWTGSSVEKAREACAEWLLTGEFNLS